ncbi:hypothetical protein A4G99_12830 [Haladaptatus sp. R4]|uniref:hypothetical protein n=1 Tax=Haladaptatus sp. R4 TaxID=1679489 RepID=UPI0007B4E455|nr:hypothetical protein [Haladaptatus sp. R4]KZN23742.1 hypothetical protein A4G99_12830 [Haladaptatus sp. R4]
MSNNEPSPEKRIANGRTVFRVNGIDADDVTTELLVEMHDLFERHDLPLRSISVEWEVTPDT